MSSLWYDRSPVRRSWLKSAPAFSIVLLGLPLSLWLLTLFGTERLSADRQTVDASHATVLLEVQILITSDGGEPGGTALYADRYPKTIRVEHATAWSNRIAAYGAAYRVWIAPKDWTGSAAVGADGSTSVSLYPIGGSAASGPGLHYEDSGGCAGCAIDAGAPYFPTAMQQWKKLFYYGTLSPLPRGLTLTRVSPNVVTYSYPSGHDVLARGVACFDPSEPFFQKAEFALPRSDAKLLGFLLGTFIGDKSKYSQHCASAFLPLR
jgi:hypothetical protein